MRVFIGFDPAESIAASVAAFSVARRARLPVSVTFLKLSQLPLTRKQEGSTQFTFSRFLVPWLCNYKGFAVFMDCDVLCRADIHGILDVSERHSVSVVKHDYTPKSGRKFLGNEQQTYEKKNWSSVMVFNNALCSVLTPNYVNTASGLDLHQFKWCGEHMIGSLDKDWNHLVGEYPENPLAKIAHFTLGTPCFAKYRYCEFAQEWHDEKNLMLDYEREGEYSRERDDLLVS